MALKTLTALSATLLVSVGASAAALSTKSSAAQAVNSAKSTPAAAAVVSKNPVAEFQSTIAGKLRVGLSVNTATKLDGIAFKSASTTVATGDASVENTPALELTWANKLYDGPGASKYDWFAGITLERERSISSVNMKALGSTAPAQTFLLQSDRPVFHANQLSAGIRWTPTATLYFPLGFTYGFRSEASGGATTNFNLDPKVGLLAGAGLRVSPNFEIEAVYKVIRYDLTMRKTTFVPGDQEFVGSAEMAGVSAGARYIF